MLLVEERGEVTEYKGNYQQQQEKNKTVIECIYCLNEYVKINLQFNEQKKMKEKKDLKGNLGSILI